MKIVAIADTHKYYRQLEMPEGDILIHAGDIDVYKYPMEVIDFNNWLGELPYKHKIVIAGNHDGFIDDHAISFTETLMQSAIYLENSGCEIEGLKFWGSPVTPRFLSWSFMSERGEAIKKYWDEIPYNIDILITHGPPYGILDVESENKQHVGCEELIQRVMSIDLKYHIFGHIHNGYGIYSGEDGKIFINASVVNDDYQLVNKPTVIEI